MKVNIGVSNRHVHLTEEDYKILFGDIVPKERKNISQKGQYVTELTVRLETAKNYMDNVRLILPVRKYTQCELSKTDSYFFGLNPPIRESGNLEGADVITIIGPKGSITKPCAIVADRHIHITPEERIKFGLGDVDVVSIEVGKEKRAILHDVYLKVSEDAVYECHLDLDDANANFLKTGDEAIIIK